MIKLFLADDHAMLREGLRSKFNDCPGITVVGEAGTGEELVEQLREKRPNVVILDIKLPDGSGISLIERVLNTLSTCRVVVLTMYDHIRYALHAFENGASGFVVKGAPFEELMTAVEEAAANRTYLSSAMVPKLAERLRHKERPLSLEDLSAREFEVFTLLSTSVSLKEAAEQMGISEKTVATYQSRLMEKLDLTNRTDLIRLALESGLLE